MLHRFSVLHSVLSLYLVFKCWAESLKNKMHAKSGLKRFHIKSVKMEWNVVLLLSDVEFQLLNSRGLSL